MSDQPDKDSIDLFGMKVKVNDLFPPNLIGLIPPPGSGLDGMLLNTETGASVPFQTKPRYSSFGTLDEKYSVADHTYKIGRLTDYDHLDVSRALHDELERGDQQLLERLRRGIRERSEKMTMDALTGAQTTSTATADDNVLTIEKMMDIIDDWGSKMHQRNVELVRALLGSGVDVKIAPDVHRPTALLPAEFAKAFKEVQQEERRKQPMYGMDWLGRGQCMS